jgi:Fe-S-cluster-containing dehydrogenase component/anaerobic selenocysteine-containing dehydrogenase
MTRLNVINPAARAAEKPDAAAPKAGAQSGAKVFWRSLEEKADSERYAQAAHGSDVVNRTIDASELSRLKRRHFMTLSGAIGALATLEGCIRRPVEKILPYTDAPSAGDLTIGVASHYATVTAQRGEALGLLVNSHEGRPTKIEGNPDHPASAGSTDLWAQASVLDLYDHERARTPSKKGVAKSYAEADAALDAVIAEALKNGGQGLRVLAHPTLSPTFVRLRDQVKKRFPQARFHSYAPVNDANAYAGTRIAFGQALAVVPSFERAKVVVSLDSDFLLTETGSVLASRQFGQSRHMESAAGEMSRLYVVEPSMSLTGANADHRLRLEGRAIGAYLKALAAELAGQGAEIGVSAGGGEVAGVPASWIQSVAKDLLANRGASLIVVGSRQPAAVHALAAAVNRGLGNAGKTVTYTKPLDGAEVDQIEDIKSLATDLASGSVSALIVLGGNPVHDAPADAGFAAALAKVGTSFALTDRIDETASLSTWHIPLAHELETWGDAQSRAGTYAVQQPLIAPLFGARAAIEILAKLAGEADTSSYAVVRATVDGITGSDELAWQRFVQRGAGPVSGFQTLGGLSVANEAVTQAIGSLPSPSAAGELEAVFLADNKMFDGRYANNSWLQELPDQITRITWDNAALIAPSTAKQLGIENGDMIKVTVGSASIEIVAWKQPGQAPSTVGLALGWGRTKAGSTGTGAGFDVYPLRTSSAPHYAPAKIEKLGKTYPLSQTQEHDSMESRPLILDADLDEYKAQPNFTQWESPDLSVAPLWKPQDYSQGHQWGMVIDLNSCTGCGACIVACQSENNIPVVGKEQVARGREMAWLRIDRYYAGDENEPEVAIQPVGCQHCEEAPCENVCPVNATAHSPEGLNDIAYNRCIGTRYCMNNCPYKVRRFNFLNFNLEVPETRKMQFNPDVSVRFRGVIEKCSYCVQRIQGAKIVAKREERPLKDGDVVTACQQACSANAIVFGDINDSSSRVSKARAVDRNYALLSDVGTRPRTRYLGKIRNPNPEMKG